MFSSWSLLAFQRFLGSHALDDFWRQKRKQSDERNLFLVGAVDDGLVDSPSSGQCA